MTPVTKSPAALTDLDEAAAFIGQHNPAAAYRFLEAAAESFSLVATAPHSGAPYHSDKPRLHGLRSWPVRDFPRYRIFYFPERYGIHVLRVLHSARDFYCLL